MTDSETLARTCLADNGRLIDPKYSQFPANETKRLQERCRVCWHLRAAFPEFVVALIADWAKARQGDRDANGAGVETDAERGV
jgi:hypothetical protein